MSKYVAFLRAINVGGHNLVAMADLRELFEELGFAEAKTLLQSGNVVFESRKRDSAALEQLLEKETASRLKVAAEYLVRSAEELAAIVEANPFPEEAKSDPAHLHVMFLKSAPAAKNVEALRAAIVGRETIENDGKQLYMVYPDGAGRSKLTAALIDRKLGIRGTARNWNTVLKLLAMCS